MDRARSSEEVEATDPRATPAADPTDAPEAPRAPARSRRHRLLALALGYVLVEVLAMPLVARLAPLRVRAWLPAPMYVLGEPSKDRLVPRDYVLVLGDSYAEGQGDWLTAALREPGNPPFQATDVLHERTGRDVITFGSGGADNVSSIVYLTAKRFAALARFGLGEPEHVLVYFYAGNDPLDNLKRARRKLDLEARGVTSYADEELEEHVRARGREGFFKGLLGTFLAPYTLINAVTGGSAGGKGHEGSPTVESAPADVDLASATNVFRAGGRLYRYTGPAQGPCPELSEPELDFTLRLLRAALEWLARECDGAEITLVHVPSPLACYELASEQAEVFPFDDRPTRFPAAAIEARARDLRARTSEVAAELGLGFVDATPHLRERAMRELIHGPIDGKHLNRAGYEALAEVLETALR